MSEYHLDGKLAQEIVARTMQIIDSNVNVMDARGKVIGSGDRERVGELHEGALLVLSQARVVDIDEAVARHLHGVRPGVNLPLRIDGRIVGVIGLTGNPGQLRQYGELVCMTARHIAATIRLSQQIRYRFR
ncbi:sugar diacid recognition domain-containing protein [Serratia sp. root2]|nr:sugar diacid recognition domain-containing protein [Serratia sp. root2]MDT3252051.1 sugar diacid recognition domain-containing protein [Serratia sp. root2]